ncbi:hypothetical protein U5801_21380 [Lamprobacter modestohalophilus]|uniref:hypothetical protein n=1 Tax=Lamprobacter modestohalophilus TaxID=1064514 RepID=UPI002ADEFA1C|nr:hypothetical protein [Lamprobacter modestohalophilus]MEA1052337.1 hypothetical protein [Lamprobacter modestohalophilus]
MSHHHVEPLGERFATDALRVLAQHPQIRDMPDAVIEQALAAMRQAAASAMAECLEDTQAAPHLAQAAYQSAVLSVALAGLEVINQQAQTQAA